VQLLIAGPTFETLELTTKNLQPKTPSLAHSESAVTLYAKPTPFGFHN